ncbi:LysE family translocator [Haladaptatus salinisoli]|uniref:LysE family translocator n=1 Tax=Haladaptatus salinisoli TaxID=2884876 RepID=UPI001D0BAFE0|nr:LysE family translocator [Haladaptatus salinisoli]
MDVAALSLFLGASAALIVTPGPDTMYVLTRGVERGRRAGIRAASGVSTGILVHTMGAVLGLSVLLRTSAAAYAAVKYVGAAYLLYLGARTVRKDAALEIEGSDSGDGFRQGVAVNVLNPKVALFFLAFLPQFAGTGSSADARMATLGLTYAALTLVYLSAVALAAHRVGALIRESARANRALRWLAGSVFVGLGLKLALPERLV